MQERRESWVDRQIREAQERGEFDGLAAPGRRLPALGTRYEENWWVNGLIEREHLDMSALLPPQLALRREGQGLREQIAGERTEQAVRELLEDFNARVRECWRRPIEGPPVVVRPVNVDELVEWWREQRAARDDQRVPGQPEPWAQVAAPAASPARRRWRPVLPMLGRRHRDR